MKTARARGTCPAGGQKFDYTMKIIVIGDVRVGKTTFLHRFVSGEFNSHMRQSDGAGPRTKVLERDGKKILIRVWDTAGQERFRSLTTSHYRDVQGCVLMYDVTNEDSFDHILHWYHDLQDKSEPLPKVTMVGTKCHMYRVVSRERAEKLAENLEIPYMEASAELGLNVVEAFENLTEQILETLNQKSASITLTNLETEEDKKWKCGCSC